MVLNLVILQIDVQYCGGNGKVRSNQGFFTVQQTCPQCAMVTGEEITNPCKIVMAKVKNKLQKKYL